LETIDGCLKKRFDFLIKIEEGYSEQGGQLGADRALAHASDACK